MSEAVDISREPIQRIWRLAGTGPGRAGCVATDWDGHVLAHEVAGPWAALLDAAVRERRPLDDVVGELPADTLIPVPFSEDLSGPAGPITRHARLESSVALSTRLALDPFCTGTWQVETVSGSMHLFDLDHGAYSRVAGPLHAEPGPGGWFNIADLEPWPAVNSTFSIGASRLLDGVPKDLSVDEITDDCLKSLDLTTSWVTSIIQVPSELWRDDPLELTPLDSAVAISQARPRNAWLLMGSEASPVTDGDLSGEEGVFWTAPKHVQRGDLVFLYYMAPTKAITHVARVAAPAVFNDELLDDKGLKAYPNQWWAEIEGLRPIDPISYAELARLFDGQLVLRGKAGVFVPPKIVDAIVARQSDPEACTPVLQRPTGDPRLPAEPSAMSFEAWKRLATGALLLEKNVEEYVVEPLLHWLVDDIDGATWTAKARLGSLVPDYTLFRDGAPASVVEVKLGARSSRNGKDLAGPDVAQLVKYCERAGCPGALVDANRIMLFDTGVPSPAYVFERSHLTLTDLGVIRDHLLGYGSDEGSES